MSEDKRDSMIIYRSFYDSIKQLPIEDQAALWDAIFNRGLYFKKPNLKGMAYAVWLLIEPQIEANIKKYKNGKEPKTKQTESKQEANGEQKESKPEGNVNANANVNVNVNGNVSKSNTFTQVRDWYDKQLEDCGHEKRYEQLVGVLFGDNELNEPLTNVLKIPGQVSFSQMPAIIKAKNETSVSVHDVLMDMNNKPKAIKDNSSVQRTIISWMKIRRK